MKTCTKCGKIKELLDFYRDATKKDGITSSCKICKDKTSKRYYRSIKGLVYSMYLRQKKNSIKRGHKAPEYTNIDLLEWVLLQDNFENLYNNWIRSGYKIELTPSIDRLNDYKGYSFDNIQIVTWQENNQKAHTDRKNGINNKISKAVMQYNIDGTFIKEYCSIRSACRITGSYRNEVCSCCKGNKTTAGGYIWKYK